MPITISKAALSKSLREVRDKAREQGRAEGRAEAARMLEFAVQLNGHGPATVKALREGIDPAIRTSPEAATPEPEDDRDPNPLDAATLAYIDALIEAKTHHAESDGGDVAAALRQMIDDPAALEAALSGDVLPEAEEDADILKAFDESKHPRDDSGRFVGREAIHAAKSDPALAEKLREKTTDPTERKKLDAALAGEVDTGRTKAGLHRERVAASKQQKEERLGKVRKLAEEISMARRGGQDVPPEHFTELAAELPHLTVGQLRSVRESLAASFWGRRRRDEMVTALVRHAKVMAERKRAEQEATDALDFGMEAMSNTGGTGHADAGRSDLNPWREFDKDKNYGEAQHGGRMFQRHKLMAELPESDKTSHGTPDTGSILKQRGDAEPPTQPESAAPVTPEPPSSPKMRAMGNGFSPSVGSKVAVLNGSTARGAEVISISADGKNVKVRPNSFTPEQRKRMEETGDPGLYDRVTSPGFVFHPADLGNVNMWASQHLKDVTGGADAGSFLANHVVVRNDLGKSTTDPQMIRPASPNTPESPNSSPAATPNPAPSGSASAVPKDHAAALSKSRTHHNRRTDTKGTPIGRHVVYRDKAGKVNAVPAESYMGKELLAGRQNQYTVEGQYDFGPDGKPVKVSGGAASREIIGKGSTGEVFREGSNVYKKSNGNEGKVYEALKGVSGVAPGREERGEIVTPHYPNIVSVDTVPEKQRKSLGAVIKPNLPDLVNAITALSEAGYDYNDPIQVGFDKGRKAHLFDFSAATKTSEQDAKSQNLDRLSTYLNQFGLERHGKAVSQVRQVMDYIDPDSRALDSESPEALDGERIHKQLGGKPPKYAYYGFNARTIPGVAQTENRDGVTVVFSPEPLDSKFLSQWELNPAIHRDAGPIRKSVPSGSATDWDTLKDELGLAAQDAPPG